MKGSYNAVTQQASGEYGREDYEGSRKNTITSGGMIIAVLLVGAAIIYFFGATIAGWVSKNNPLTNNPVTQGIDTLTSGAQYLQGQVGKIGQGIVDNTGRIEQQMSDTGNYVGKSAGDVPQDFATLGNVITSNEAQSAGVRAADTVNSLGLAPAYWGLPDWQRGLVSLGEGIGSVFGVDLIQMGAQNAAANNNNNQATGQPMIGDNQRAALIISQSQPDNATQNLDPNGVTLWNEYYGGMT